MPQNFDQIRAQNKIMMMEISALNLNTDEGKARRRVLMAELNANNSDLRALAASFGSDRDLPRTMQIKKRIGNYGTKK